MRRAERLVALFQTGHVCTRVRCFALAHLMGLLRPVPSRGHRPAEALRTAAASRQGAGPYDQGMRIEFTYARSPEYFRGLLRPMALRAVRRVAGTALGLAAVGVLLVVGSQGEGVGTLVGIPAAFASLMLLFTARRVYVETVTVPAIWTESRTFMVTDDGLESTSSLTSLMWAWPAVRRVEPRPEAYLFWRDGEPMFDVPRQPLTAEDEQSLRAFLAERGLLGSDAPERR